MIRRLFLLLLAIGAVFAPAAGAATAQQVVDETAAWLQERGIPVEPRQVVVLAEWDAVPQAAKMPWAMQPIAIAGEEALFFHRRKSQIDRLSRRWGRRGWIGEMTTEALLTVLHELLHTVGDEEWDGATRTQRAREEGIVEQVSRDLYPAAAWQLLGHRSRGPVTWGPYEQRAREARRASVRETRSGVQTYRARSWRQKLLLASYTERDRLLRGS